MTADNGSSYGRTEVDELLRTLSHSVRREIIRYFENQPAGATASLEELVDHLESRESTKAADGLWKTLYQVHLPTLQSRGWLHFDMEREIVTYHGHDAAEDLIGTIHDLFKE